MKRLILVFISLIVIFSLCGCKKEKPKSLTFDATTIKIGDSHTDFEGVNIKIADILWDKNSIKLDVDWINDTKYEILYGNPYTVELKKSGEWVSAQKTDELYFTTIGYILKPHKTQQKTYDLTDTFDISSSGIYRLKTDCSVYNKGKNAKAAECNLWVEFSVTQKADANSSHTHTPAKNAQTVSEPISGYCGNTQTTIYFDNGKKYTFMSGNSVTMTDILVNLDYDKNKLCKCLPEYTVDTEFGNGYGINLTSGYARCDKGQADLTNKQIEKFKEIIKWAEDKSE